MGNVVSSAFGKFLVVGALLGLVAGTSGCKKLLKKKGGDGGTTAGDNSSDPKTAADDADDQLQDKINEYIRCQNTTSSATWSARKRYLDKIPKTGPTGKETYAYAEQLPKESAQNCSTNVGKAKLMPPKDPKLEAAGDDYAKVITEIDGLMNQIYTYFENKDFRDDKWAKGKGLHPQIMGAFDRFRTADHNLHIALDGITKPLSQRTLARIEREEGKKFYWHRLHTLNAARDVVEASDPPGEEDDVDFNFYSSAYNDFEKALDDLSAYGNAHKADLGDQKRAPHWPVADSNFDEFVKSGGDLKKTAKTFWRCMRDAPAKVKTPTGKIDVDKMTTCPDGKPIQLQDDVFKKYNEFIHTSNSSRFP